jgi:hypothetical protein
VDPADLGRVAEAKTMAVVHERWAGAASAAVAQSDAGTASRIVLPGQLRTGQAALAVRPDVRPDTRPEVRPDPAQASAAAADDQAGREVMAGSDR